MRSRARSRFSAGSSLARIWIAAARKPAGLVMRGRSLDARIIRFTLRGECERVESELPSRSRLGSSAALESRRALLGEGARALLRIFRPHHDPRVLGLDREGLGERPAARLELGPLDRLQPERGA